MSDSASEATPRGSRARHGAQPYVHRMLRLTAAGLAAVLGFSAAFGLTYLYKIEHSFTTKDISTLLTLGTFPSAEPVSEDPVDASAGKPVNILLIGSDVRNGENGNIGGIVGGMRSDTTLLMHVSADRSRIDFLSFPRDSRVRVSDCKLFDGSTVRGWTAKFNVAFANGGKNGDASEAAACTMQTITDLTGINFDHYVVIDFIGFKRMIDSLGGVPMCIPNDVDSTKAQLHLKAGPQVLNGTKALAWSRARTGVGLGDGTDLMRIDRQHELINNLMRKAFGLNLLTDATAATQFVKSAAESATMDPALGSVGYLLGLAFSLRNIDTENINFATVPWRYPGDRSGDIVWTEDSAITFAKIRKDKPLVTPPPEPSVSASASPGVSGSATPTSPSASPSPKRETQKEILADCNV